MCLPTSPALSAVQPPVDSGFARFFQALYREESHYLHLILTIYKNIWFFREKTRFSMDEKGTCELRDPSPGMR